MLMLALLERLGRCLFLETFHWCVEGEMSSVSSLRSGGTLQSCFLQTSASLQPSGEEIPPRNLELVALIALTDASLKDELLLKHRRVIHSRVPPSRTPLAQQAGAFRRRYLWFNALFSLNRPFVRVIKCDEELSE